MTFRLLQEREAVIKNSPLSFRKMKRRKKREEGRRGTGRIYRYHRYPINEN